MGCNVIFHSRRLFSLFIPLFVGVCSSPPTYAGGDATCALTIELVDADDSATLPGLIRLSTDDGARIPISGLPPRGLGVRASAPVHDWFVIIKRSVVQVKQRPLLLEAVHGLTTELGRIRLDLRGKSAATARVRLRRFHKDDRYRSANTHVHLKDITRTEAENYLRDIPRGDDLDIVFVSNLARIHADKTYISNEFTREDFRRLSLSGTLFGNGEEHRHNFSGYEGYGHVMFLDIKKLILPVSIGPAIMNSGTDGTPLRRGIDTARHDGATVIWCHGKKGIEDLPNVVAGRLHAQNIYDSGGISGSYSDTFYRYLNVGIPMPFSTGTDWFIFDFARAYARIEGDHTVQNWLRALRSGRSYITNGPLLHFTVDGHELGDIVHIDRPQQLRVVGHGVSRIDFRQLELIQNGEIIATSPARRVGAHFEAHLEQDVQMNHPAWLALRTPVPPRYPLSASDASTPTNLFGRPLYSHTSPVYVRFQGHDFYDVPTGENLLAEMILHRGYIADNFFFADKVEREQVLRVHDTAISLFRELHARERRRVRAQHRANDR